MSVVKVIVYRTDDVEPWFDYKTDHVPMVGDRIFMNRAGMLVTDRMWCYEINPVRMTVEIRVEIEQP